MRVLMRKKGGKAGGKCMRLCLNIRLMEADFE
jgi:hypothetical protein